MPEWRIVLRTAKISVPFLLIIISGLSGCGSSALLSTGKSPSSVSVFYVSPTGLDTNPGTLSQPFRAIQRCATVAIAGQTCAVRTGTYHETVTPNSGISILPYSGESVTIDGSDAVTGWTVFQGSIYKAAATLAGDDTNQVFVGNQMMTEARWPNGDDLFHVNWATAQAGTTTVQIVDSDLPAIDWTGSKIHLWSGTDPFGHQTGIVSSSDAGQLGINVEVQTCPDICPAVGGYFYLFGILGALDQQREWFYDAAAGNLYFWAPNGVNPNTVDVRAKRREYAFDLSGKSHVTIQNINLFASSIKMDPASTDNILDGLSAQYVSHFTALPPAAGDTTGFSILSVHTLDTGLVIDGTGNSLINSTIAYSAGDGVAVLGTNSTIENNLIHHVDYVGDYSSGIVIAGNGSSVHHNTIHTVGRTAINYSTATNEDIGYNNMFNAMYLSRDGAEIYACCDFIATETRIHHNWTHDTHIVATPSTVNNYALSGIYIDNASAGFEIDQNVSWNNEVTNIFLNGAGEPLLNNNYVHNNSIPDASSNGYILVTEIPNCGTTQIVDNVVLIPVASSCSASNNNASAPGAFEMTSAVAIGCNFAGCTSSPPPSVSNGLVSASIVLQPRDAIVTAGQTATFTVTAAGSPELTYQWQENGHQIVGATDVSYTIPAVVATDNGAVFTVVASNPVGSATSSPATLTVQ